MSPAGHARGLCAIVPAMWLGVIAFTYEAGLCANKYPQNIGPIELDDVRWQFLPQTIQAVFVGTDGRIWYQLHHPDEEENLPIVRRIIEGQFQETSPQLFGAEPALFESNGRVWFRTHSRKMLLGYNGRDWVERPAGSGVRFTSNCPRHGRMDQSDDNLEMDGTLFFPDEQGVHTFSGQGWNYQAMGPTAFYNRIVVRAEPGNRGVIAINPSNPSEVWCYRQGQWHDERLREPGIRDILPAQGDGVWLLTSDDDLQFHSFDGDDKDPPKVPAGDASNTSASPKFHLLHCDSPTGRCFLVLERPAPQQQDLLILNDGEGPVVIPRYEGPAAWNAIWSENSGPIFTPDGQSVWIPGRHESRGCDKLDLAASILTDRIPDPAFYWIHAVHPDKTVFISTREPEQPTFALAAYRPGAPMPTNLLDGWTYTLQSDPLYPAVCVDSTGDVWAALEDRGLYRFDGMQWQTIEGIPPDCGRVHLLLPGTAGRIIVGTDRGFYYRKDGSATKYNSLRDVIAENLHDVIACYQTSTPRDRCYIITFVSVVADGAGNVWLLDQRKLSVFTNGQWLDAKPALLASGSRAGEVEYVNTVGGRGAVYLSDFVLQQERGRSFFAEIEDGRIVVSDAPHCTEWGRMQLSIRDPADTLWIPGSFTTAGATCDLINGQLVPRGGDRGVIQPFGSLGWPMLCDASGIVWTGEIQGEPATKFNLWRERSIRGQVEIPFDPCWLFSDRQGSVYVWTRSGLYHLTASVPGLTDYAVSEYYVTPAILGDIEHFAYSEKGFIVLRAESFFSPRVFRLVMIPIPVPK